MVPWPTVLTGRRWFLARPRRVMYSNLNNMARVVGHTAAFSP